MPHVLCTRPPAALRAARPGTGAGGRRARPAPARAEPPQPQPQPQASPDDATPSAGAPPPRPRPRPRVELNPVQLGRQARAAVGDAWRRLLSLGGAPRGAGGAGGDGDDALDGWRARDGAAPAAGGGGGDGGGDGRPARRAVLVVGATGRVGTVLARKLALRGYAVRALVRDTEAARQCLPQSVELVQGDIGSPGDCARAAAGCSKAVYAATARSTVAADLEVADKRGVRNVVNALLDARNAAAVGAGVAAGAAGVGVKRALWKFSYAGDADAWAPDPAPASVAADLARALRFAAPPVELGQVATGELRWAGRVLARGAASASAPLPPLALAGGDGVTFRARGDGRARYACVVLAGDAPEEEEEGGAGEADGEGGGAAAAAPPRRARGPAPRWFGAAFTPRRYYTPFRLAFDAFVPLDGGPPARLDPAAALRLGFRFDSRAQPAAAAAAAPPQQQQRAQAAEGAARGGGGGGPAKPPRAGRPGEALSLMAELAAARAGLAKEPRGGGGGAGRGFAEPDANAFALEVAFVKLLPGGAEPDFVLVSCASGDGGGGGGGPGGVGPGPGRTPAQAAAVVEAKRWAEAALRGSGLGYTVVRPGRLSDSPGGGSPLLFDQSGRLGGDIAAADVADVCLRALHDGGARNTSFDVAREPPGQAGAAAYELVAQVASPALGGGNYLAPALAQLEKNT